MADFSFQHSVTGCRPLLKSFSPPLFSSVRQADTEVLPPQIGFAPASQRNWMTKFSPVANRKFARTPNKMFEVVGRTPEPDVRVRVRRIVVQVHGEHAGLCTIVPVTAALNGTSSEQGTGLNINFSHLQSNPRASYPSPPISRKYPRADPKI